MALEKIEHQEDKEDVVLRVIVFRHGPKLSAAGEKNVKAAYFNDSVKRGFEKMNLEKGKGLARVTTSSVQRAVDTAEIAQGEIGSTDHRTGSHVRKDKKLEVPFQPQGEAEEKRFAMDLERIISFQKELQPRITEEIEKEFPDLEGESKEAEIRNKIDMAVLSEFFEEEKNPLPARRFETTCGELADIFAKRYMGFARHVDFLEKRKETGDRQPHDEPYVQIDVTHSFPVTAFLKKYLVFEDGERAENLDPEEFFQRTGGIIRESGSLQMDFINSNPPKIKLEAEFEPGKKFRGLIDLDPHKDHGKK